MKIVFLILLLIKLYIYKFPPGKIYYYILIKFMLNKILNKKREIQQTNKLDIVRRERKKHIRLKEY